MTHSYTVCANIGESADSVGVAKDHNSTLEAVSGPLSARQRFAHGESRCDIKSTAVENKAASSLCGCGLVHRYTGGVA
jgi:hypothetical protein